MTQSPVNPPDSCYRGAMSIEEKKPDENSLIHGILKYDTKGIFASHLPEFRKLLKFLGKWLKKYFFCFCNTFLFSGYLHASNWRPQGLYCWGDVWHRQGPRFSIRMIIWIFCSDTDTGTLWWWFVFLLIQQPYFQRVRRQCCLPCIEHHSFILHLRVLHVALGKQIRKNWNKYGATASGG